MLEDLIGSRYLMNVYAVSSDSWENFRQTGQQASLYEVAAALCGAWTTLAEDQEFFGGLKEMATELMQPDLAAELAGAPTPTVAGTDATERQKFVAEFGDYLDVDKLLARELVVLVQAGMNSVHAVRLISDLRDLLGNRVTGPPSPTLSLLQPNVQLLADQLCKAQTTLPVFNYDPLSDPKAEHAPHRRWVRTLHLFGRTLGGTAGAASAVANVVAAIGSFGALTGLGLASVLAGAGAMSDAIADVIEGSTPGQPTTSRGGTPPAPAASAGAASAGDAAAG
jgi:hypothetical protein